MTNFTRMVILLIIHKGGFKGIHTSFLFIIYSGHPCEEKAPVEPLALFPAEIIPCVPQAFKGLGLRNEKPLQTAITLSGFPLGSFSGKNRSSADQNSHPSLQIEPCEIGHKPH